MVRLGVGLCKRLGIGLEARDKVRGWAGDRLEALGVGCSPAAGRRGRACSAISPLYLRYISAISPLYLRYISCGRAARSRLLGCEGGGSGGSSSAWGGC